MPILLKKLRVEIRLSPWRSDAHTTELEREKKSYIALYGFSKGFLHSRGGAGVLSGKLSGTDVVYHCHIVLSRTATRFFFQKKVCFCRYAWIEFLRFVRLGEQLHLLYHSFSFDKTIHDTYKNINFVTGTLCQYSFIKKLTSCQQC